MNLVSSPLVGHVYQKNGSLYAYLILFLLFFVPLLFTHISACCIFAPLPLCDLVHFEPLLVQEGINCIRFYGIEKMNM